MQNIKAQIFGVWLCLGNAASLELIKLNRVFKMGLQYNSALLRRHRKALLPASPTPWMTEKKNYEDKMNSDSLGVRPNQKANTRILLSWICSLRGCEKMSAYYLGHSVWDILIGKPEKTNTLVQGRRIKVLIWGNGGNCKGCLFVMSIPSFTFPSNL